MGMKSLQSQIKTTFAQKARIGESRHAAKQELRENYTKNGEKVPFGASVEGIHSLKTLKDYKEIGVRFANWCIENKGIAKYSKLDKIKPLAVEYLKERESKGLSLYTLKTERAALGKLFGEQIPYKFEKPRTYKDITRSRGEKVRDTHFSEENNYNLVMMAKATGARRSDLAHMRAADFFEDRGNLWVKIEQSKGGRNRIAPVLPAYKEEVKLFIAERADAPRLFDKIHNGADIHAYRREYAQDLYDIVRHDPTFAGDCRALYGPRNEPGISGDIYYSHDKEHPFAGNRDDIYIVSEALGHNRLDVSVNHYLK